MKKETTKRKTLERVVKRPVGGLTRTSEKVAEGHQLDVKEVIAAANGDKKTDFRSLADPQRTVERMTYLLRLKELTHGERVAACLIVREFENEDSHRKILVIRDLLPLPAFSLGISTGVPKKLESLGLIRRRVIRATGTEIELLF